MSLKNARFLVVDDEPINLNIISTILRAEGHDVVTYASGLTALKACREGDARFDLVLLDVHMPVLNGLETALCLRQIPAMVNVPVVFVSARASASDQAAGRAAGGCGYLTKPFKRQDLLNAINAATQQPSNEEIA